MAIKNATKTPGRPFKRGNPGRPKGSRNKSTLLLEAMLDVDAPTLMTTAIDMAKAGDGTMMRLCLERLLPPRRDRPVNFELPALSGSADAAKASLSILQATSSGHLTPIEAAEL